MLYRQSCCEHFNVILDHAISAIMLWALQCYTWPCYIDNHAVSTSMLYLTMLYRQSCCEHYNVILDHAISAIMLWALQCYTWPCYIGNHAVSTSMLYLTMLYRQSCCEHYNVILDHTILIVSCISFYTLYYSFRSFYIESGPIFWSSEVIIIHDTNHTILCFFFMEDIYLHRNGPFGSASQVITGHDIN